MENKLIGQGATKVCGSCKQQKPLADFNKNRSSKDGLQAYCRPCNRAMVLKWQKDHPDKANAKGTAWKREHRDQHNEANRAYKAENREKVNDANRVYMRRKRDLMSLAERSIYNRRIDLSRKYHISMEDYDAMLIAQDGRCAICSAPITAIRALAVDHDHKTNRNRGLLCGHCNPLLHKLEADADWLYKALNYLKGIV